jgi:hypothetical protein
MYLPPPTTLTAGAKDTLVKNKETFPHHHLNCPNACFSEVF